LALFAFAGNSVLCRLALGDNAIDATSFTAIRLGSGAVVLALILWFSMPKQPQTTTGSWRGALMLFIYAAAFSFAYVSLETGIGALILFASVQLTMIIASQLKGHKLHVSEWLGVTIAFSGFVYLVLPTLTEPSFIGFILMMSAGIAWGCYSLIGQGSCNPLSDTTYNFIKSIPFVVLLLGFTLSQTSLSSYGVGLAVLSGVVTSAIGYTIWYHVLTKISTVQASVVQLIVPVIATFGGVIFANEVVTLHIILSSTLILGGIIIVLIGQKIYQTQLSD